MSLTLVEDQKISLVEKVSSAEELLRDIVTRHQSVVFASSLGAEDMVLTDLILSRRLPIEIFTLDTGRLPAETYDLLARVSEKYQYHLKVYCPDTVQLETYVRSKGINAFYESVELRKECCRVRKVEPLKRALAGNDAWVTGLRSAQAATRGALPVGEYDLGNGLWKYSPLADWSEKEVWAYVREHRVPYNRLHDKHYPSIGCAPCTRAITAGEDIRAGRWWWENPETKECGLHLQEGKQ